VFTQVFGVRGANQAIWNRQGRLRQIFPMSFVTCLGDDDNARRMIESFRKDNLNVDFAVMVKGVATGTALILVDENGMNSIAVAPGANYSMSAKHIDSALGKISDVEYVILQMEIPVDTTRYIIDTAKKYNRKVIFNVAPAIVIEDSYLAKTDILIVNETEASLLTGTTTDTNTNIEKAAKILRNKGFETVIITLGANGSYVNDGKTKTFIPGFKVKAVDSTAAGDTYCGALAVALTEGRSITEAIQFAGAASAISVTRLGAQPSVPYRKEIDEFLKLQKKLYISGT
jgi:ribokinase